jgi:uncharacterized protein YdhG (YjbR/CyaY superfamily)
MEKFDTIDEYIAQFPEEIRNILQEIRELIKKEAPEATERIAYGLATFYLNGNLVHFGAQTNHIGLYPTASGISNFEAELKNYKYAKGSVQFPLDKPIPYPLIKKIVKFRVTENSQKTAKRK